jgi:hypothetical protein
MRGYGGVQGTFYVETLRAWGGFINKCSLIPLARWRWLSSMIVRLRLRQRIYSMTECCQFFTSMRSRRRKCGFNVEIEMGKQRSERRRMDFAYHAVTRAIRDQKLNPRAAAMWNHSLSRFLQSRDHPLGREWRFAHAHSGSIENRVGDRCRNGNA